MITQVFNYLSKELPSILHFSVPFAKYSLFTSLGRMLGRSLQSKHPLFHTIPCMFLVHQNDCFVGWYFFGGWNEYPWKFPRIKTPISLITFISAISGSITMQDILLQKSTQIKKRKVERVLRKGKRIVHLRDQANMNLVLAQSCNSDLDLHHYVPALLQQHHVILNWV